MFSRHDSRHKVSSTSCPSFDLTIGVDSNLQGDPTSSPSSKGWVAILVVLLVLAVLSLVAVKYRVKLRRAFDDKMKRFKK
jgi:hypothetical protein